MRIVLVMAALAVSMLGSGCPATVETPAGPPELFFVAYDTGAAPQRQLWRTDGTAAGTGLLLGVTGWAEGSNPSSLSVIEGALYFSAVHEDGNPSHLVLSTLWASDGTAFGTRILATPNAPPVGPLVGCGALGYYSAPDSQGFYQPWRTDGTSAGTFPVQAADPGPLGTFPQSMACVGSTLFYFRDDGVYGLSLWQTEGTVATTGLVRSFSGVRSAWHPIAMGGRVYFMASDGAEGIELWSSDGTYGGTAVVKDITPDGSPVWPSTDAAVFGDLLYFVANDFVAGPELWTTDGTEAGTALLVDLYPGAIGAVPGNFTVHGGALYFTASGGATGNELWRTDGTEAGTVLVKNLCPGDCSSGPFDLVSTPAGLLFAADDAITGVALWRTDGTDAGTVRVKDVSPYTDLPYVSALTRSGDRAYFVVGGGAAGVTLWVTDGTEEGTRQVPGVCELEPCFTLEELTAF